MSLKYEEWKIYCHQILRHVMCMQSLILLAINSTHTNYNISSYNCEMDYRSKKKGGGVSLYIHNALQYKHRNDPQLGGDVNSVFLELFKHTTNTKYNVTCGCIYRPPSMSLKECNKLLSITFYKIKQERKYVYISGD